jgi:hypothetical protein
MKTRLVLAATVLTLAVRADDEITVPLDLGPGGGIKALTVAKPIRAAQNSPFFSLDGLLGPCPSAFCIVYEIEEVGDMGMKTIDLKLQLDLGGLCSKKPSQWSVQTEDRFWRVRVSRSFQVEGTKGCTVDLAKVTLISASYETKILAHNDVPEVDFTDQLKAIQARRDTEEVLAAGRKRKEAEAAARRAKIKAAEDAKAQEERAKARAACSAIYQSTIDRKVADLTVREEQQVRACQALGLYPPR